MTIDEFDKKWKGHKEQGHYGMAINIPRIIEYMDAELTKEKEVNPTFTFSQIKLKFGTARVYTSSDKATQWERGINALINRSD